MEGPYPVVGTMLFMVPDNVMIQQEHAKTFDLFAFGKTIEFFILQEYPDWTQQERTKFENREIFTDFELNDERFDPVIREILTGTLAQKAVNRTMTITEIIEKLELLI